MITENFFCNDEFYYEIEDLLIAIDIDEENIDALPDDWVISCEETQLEKIFVLKEDFVINAIIQSTDYFEDRFPEDSDHIFKQIEKAVKESIDIRKMNDLLPSLHYVTKGKFIISKDDLKEYFNH